MNLDDAKARLARAEGLDFNYWVDLDREAIRVVLAALPDPPAERGGWSESANDELALQDVIDDKYALTTAMRGYALTLRDLSQSLDAMVAMYPDARRLAPIPAQPPAPSPRPAPAGDGDDRAGQSLERGPLNCVTLATTDNDAQDLLWAYAQRRRAADAVFADKLESALSAAGYVGKKEFPVGPQAPPPVDHERAALALRLLDWLGQDGEREIRFGGFDGNYQMTVVVPRNHSPVAQACRSTPIDAIAAALDAAAQAPRGKL